MLQINKSGIINAAPAVILISFICFPGIIAAFLESFGLWSLTEEPGITTGYYRQVFTDQYYFKSIIFSIWIAFSVSITAGLITVFLLAIIYYFHLHSPLLGKIFGFIVVIPLYVPYISAALLFSFLLMQSGWISSALFQLGFINSPQDFPILVNDTTGIGMIITFTWKTVPFLLIVITPVMLRFVNSYEKVAKTIGASESVFFIQIMLPVIIPQLLTLMIILFTFILTAYEIPFILGVTHPKTIAVISYQLYSQSGLDQRPVIASINMIVTSISIVSLISIGLLYKVISKNQRGWA